MTLLDVLAWVGMFVAGWQARTAYVWVLAWRRRAKHGTGSKEWARRWTAAGDVRSRHGGDR